MDDDHGILSAALFPSDPVNFAFVFSRRLSVGLVIVVVGGAGVTLATPMRQTEGASDRNLPRVESAGGAAAQKVVQPAPTGNALDGDDDLAPAEGATDVPDGGSTVSLLGLAMIAMVGIRKFVRRRRESPRLE